MEIQKALIAKSADDPRLFTVSTDSVDRYGDVLKQNWRLDPFVAAGAPALLNHNPNQIIGSWADLSVENGRFKARFVPAEPGTSEVSDAAAKLVDQGILRGASVGLIAHRRTELDDGGYELDDLELMEISLTPVPANSEAIAAFRDLSPAVARQLISLSTERTMTQENTARRVPDSAPAIFTKERKYSLSRAIAGMLRIPGAPDDGLEREVANEMAKRNPRKSWNGIPVPFKVLFPSVQKANAGAPGGTGHPLTGTAYLDNLLSVQDGAIPKEMLGGRLGAPMISTNELVAQLPIIDGKVTASTVALDADIPLSDFSSQNVTISPVTAGARTQIKRSLFYSQHPDAEGIIRRQVSAAVGEELDRVWLGPTAGAPQPDGLLDQCKAAALLTVLGTEASWREFREELLAYLQMPDPDETIRFLMPTIAEDKLSTTEKWTGNTAVPTVNNGRIADTPVVRTHLLDVSTPNSVPVLCGQFTQMYLILFNQGGADVVANPYISGSWEHGGYELRALVDYNVHLLDSKRILKSTYDAS